MLSRRTVENVKSQRIPERLGFRRDGVPVRAEWTHDHFHDLVVYAVLAVEWRAAGGDSARRT